MNDPTEALSAPLIAPTVYANQGRAELLMPEPTVREAWAELADLDACAKRFDVSPTAMHWRLFGFFLVGDRPSSEPVPSEHRPLDV